MRSSVKVPFCLSQRGLLGQPHRPVASLPVPGLEAGTRGPRAALGGTFLAPCCVLPGGLDATSFSYEDTHSPLRPLLMT